MSLDHPFAETAAIRTQIGAIFVSLELSRSRWLITSLSPGAGEKMSKHGVEAGDVSGLLARLAELKRKALARTKASYPIIVLQEAGLDGFWLHRLLEKEGCESHVVDAASIAAPRRRRRVKTDRIDGEALVRVLLAFKRGEPRVCSMVRAPTPEAEDERRICRERAALIEERIRHVNRIKGLLFSQGIGDYEPLRRNRRQRLEALRAGDGRALAPHLKAQIERELDRLELLLNQIKTVEAARDALLAQVAMARAETETKTGAEARAPEPTPPAAMLMSLRGIGPEFAAVLWTEGLCRSFSNRRQAAAYAGLTPTPWQSGTIDHEQGVSKAGNPRLRTKMLELAWLWLRHQPQSALSRWFKQRLPGMVGRAVRKRLIVALARKLFVALWKYVSAGVVIEGAIMKTSA
jgi:transposase